MSSGLVCKWLCRSGWASGSPMMTHMDANLCFSRRFHRLWHKLFVRLLTFWPHIIYIHSALGIDNIANSNNIPLYSYCRQFICRKMKTSFGLREGDQGLFLLCVCVTEYPSLSRSFMRCSNNKWTQFKGYVCRYGTTNDRLDSMVGYIVIYNLVFNKG